MAMAVGEVKEGEPVVDINTTPLIDVMLVLLIMFIVTLPPQRHAVNLDTPIPPPEGTPPPEVPPPDPIRVFVDFDGTVYWNGAVVNRAEMENQMMIEERRAVQPEIHIEPHRLANYGKVMEVMASAQRIGLQKLGVIGGT
jgi:biopolymer transport protein ExbD